MSSFVSDLVFWITYTTLLTYVILWIQKLFFYWEMRGLATPPQHLIWGNIEKLIRQTGSFAMGFRDGYTYFVKNKLRHGGIYFIRMPIYMPVDPNIIKHILKSDFNYFVNRGIYYNERDDPLSAHLFSLDGKAWKKLREKMTPAFSPAHLKTMVQTVTDCSDQLVEEMDKIAGKKTIEFKDIFSRYTIDVIASVGFGINCNSLQEPDSELKRNAMSFLEKTKLENFLLILGFTMADFMRFMRLKFVSASLSSYFFKIIKSTVDYREKNNVFRKDFMHLMIQLKNRGKVTNDQNLLPSESVTKENTITFNELAAQAFLFFVAGFETSSSTLCLGFYELATHPEIQEKLIDEINMVSKKYNGQITYEFLKELTYMDQFLSETLRKYPVIAFLNRSCVKDYKIPGTDFIIEKDTKVVISTLGLHMDEQYFPDPETFDPDRFSEENKSKTVPFTYLPFGDGPRVCIGMRLGVLQMKVAMAALLKRYRFSLNPKTSSPIEFDPACYVLSAKGGIWLDVHRIES